MQKGNNPNRRHSLLSSRLILQSRVRLAAIITVLTCSTLPASAQLLHLRSGAVTAVFDTHTADVQLKDESTGKSWDLGVPVVVSSEGQSTPVAPMPSGQNTATSLRFKDQNSGLLFSLSLTVGNAPCLLYKVEGLADNPSVKEVDLLSQALPLDGAGSGYYAIPSRLGILVDPLNAKSGESRYDAYQVSHGYSMAMLGAVDQKDQDSALLIYWNSPNVSILTDGAADPTPRVTASVALEPGSDTLYLEPLGRGSYVTIARAYRAVAEREGLVKTIAQKEADNPKIAALIGDPDFKLLVYEQRVARDGSGHETTTLHATFADEAALAHHLKYDVGIDHALMVLEGWNRAGYDNQLPDILPAAAPAGGNAGLATCSDEVRKQGWLFGLHDNYQDMYRTAPSWNPYYIIKRKDGSLMTGGFWAGGRAYFICSLTSVQLLYRPQNFPGVLQLFHPDAYFLDTIFAAPLRFCYDPRHPTNRVQDIHGRQALCDAVRRKDVLLGSEEGNEYGVAHADYFEGMLSQKTHSHHPGAEEVIPLFEMVYGDSIPIYTHQSDKLTPEQPEQFLDHVLYGEMPVYYTPSSHTYWTTPTFHYSGLPGTRPTQFVFAQGNVASNRVDSFIRNTYEVLRPLSLITVNEHMTDHRFLTPDHSVEMSRFGKDTTIVVNYGDVPYKDGTADLPPYGFYIDSPDYQAFYATRFHTMDFTEPTMMTILCGEQEGGMGATAAQSAHSCRIFHAFGDSHARIFGVTRSFGESGVDYVSR
jgi:hypothetical protein